MPIFGQKLRIMYLDTEATEKLPLGLVFGSFEFDASIEEEHKVSVDVTDHPVESGAQVSDHKVKRPNELTVRAIVTTTPPLLGAFLRIPNVSTRDVDTWTLLNELAEGKELLTVITTLKTYDNMTIKEMSVPRTAALGNSLEVSITFRELFTVESAEVVAPEEKTGSAKGKKKTGDGASKAATGKKRTLLKLGLDSVGSFFN